MEPFEFDESRTHARGNGLVVTKGVEGEMFRRRAIKGIGGTPYQVEYCVVIVNGVYVYITEGHVFVSDKDLLP